MLARNDLRRTDVIGLVRRQVAAGTFTKADVAAWKEDLGEETVDQVVAELAPKKKAAKAETSKKTDPDKE